ncbi:hypothetical protein LTS18_002918, partial [Coniosporium uncinatum]
MGTQNPRVARNRNIKSLAFPFQPSHTITDSSRPNGKLIRIHLGPPGKRQIFSALKSILCATSDFFHAALNGDWEEKKTGIVKLPEEEDGKAVGPAADVEYLLLARLYVLGDKMQDAVFRNSVIDAIASKTEAPTPASRTVRAWEAFYPSMIVTQYIYSHTPATSPLRQLMLDMYVWNASNATWFNDSDREVAPREFLWGFCAAEC